MTQKIIFVTILRFFHYILGFAAFLGCSKLSQVVFTSGLKLIGEWMFRTWEGNPTMLTSLTIPSTVISISERMMLLFLLLSVQLCFYFILLLSILILILFDL